MPAPLGSTSANVCSSAPARANRKGEGATQLRLKGLVFVFTSDRGGHVTCEHARYAGQGRLNSLLLALVLPCGASGMDCVTCHKTDGFTPPLNITTTKQSITNTNILSHYSLFPVHPFKDGVCLWGLKLHIKKPTTNIYFCTFFRTYVCYFNCNNVLYFSAGRVIQPANTGLWSPVQNLASIHARYLFCLLYTSPSPRDRG